MCSQKWLCTGTVAAKGLSENTVLGQQALRPAESEEVMYGMDIPPPCPPGLGAADPPACALASYPGAWEEPPLARRIPAYGSWGPVPGAE